MLSCVCAGLSAPAAGYAAGLRARGLHGRKLLTLRCDDLEYLGVTVIGHQELILEAVEQLRDYVSTHHQLQSFEKPLKHAMLREMSLLLMMQQVFANRFFVFRKL